MTCSKRTAAALLAGCAWAGAGHAAQWHFCAAATVDLPHGKYVVLQSDPFDTAGVPDWRERVLSARSFEARFAELGVRDDASLDATTVLCSLAAETREQTLRDRVAFRRDLDKSRPAGAALAEATWPAPLPASRGPHQPPLLDFAGRHASAATRASSPGRWGLTAGDFGMLHSQAMLKKAGLPGRREELTRAAAQGDAYAQFLLAVRPPGEPDDLEMMKRAADQGLVRAISNVHDALAARGGADRAEHVAELRRMADLGSPHARYVLASTLAEGQGAVDGGEVEDLVLKAAVAGYAPAQYNIGEQLSMAPGRQHWRDGRDWLQKAADQGLAEAADLLKNYPPEPAE